MACADSKALFIIIIGRLPSLHSLNKKVIVAKVEKLLAICDLLETHVTNNQTHAEHIDAGSFAGSVFSNVESQCRVHSNF